MAEQTRSSDALPELVFTETLPEGVLFVSPDGVLYQVVLAEGAGFRKAEPWPWSTSRVPSEHRQPVALVAGSFLARNYALVEKGRRLPTLTRSAFIDSEGRYAHFIFPDEALAKLAAQLDETLTPQSGLTAYPENDRWVLGDGQHLFRVYHYALSSHGQVISLSERFAREHIRARECTTGPAYWQYLPGWMKPSAALATGVERTAVPPQPAITPATSPVAMLENAVSGLETAPVEPTVKPAADLPRAAIEPAPATGVERTAAPPQPTISTATSPVRVPESAVAGFDTAPVEPAAKPAADLPHAAIEPAPTPVVAAAPAATPARDISTPAASPADKTNERRFDFRSLFGLRGRDQQDKVNNPPSGAPPVNELPPIAIERPEEKAPPAAQLEAVSGPPESPPVIAEPPPTVAADQPSPAPTAPLDSPQAIPRTDDEMTVMAVSKSRKPRRTLMMVLSVDLGYGYTKGVGAESVRFSFPSVIGTAEDIRFATNLINGSADRTVKYDGTEFFYGDQALLQSRMLSTIFDRSRVHDQLYKMLFVGALVEMHKQAPDIERVRLVTGLPVEFFNDRADVVNMFEGTYQITTDHSFRVTVESVFVAPQPFGSLFRELLNDQGRINNTEIEKGRVGVIDIGTYTTDFIVADELRYVQRLSGSARIGWSKVINKVEQALGDAYGLDLTPHQIDRALNAGAVRVRGATIPLQDMMEPAIAEVRAAIIARARDLWGEGVSLDTILVTGGGAMHLYDLIHEVYPHARLLDEAFWANAEGFYRFARRPATFKE